MKILRRQFLHLPAFAAAFPFVSMISFLLPGHVAWSQATKTVKIVVPVPPGGGIDILTEADIKAE
jgi:hypothetical protein